MSKQYGLILPGQQKMAAAEPRTRTTRPSVFDESSSDDEEEANMNLPKLKSNPSMGPSMMERRIARRLHEDALSEDPTVFQYDEVYDEMVDAKKDNEKDKEKSKEARKPKYIGRLMKHAERRKLENELRLERQVQKEREAEGEMYKDKETYVTSTYRKKLEEIRKMQEMDKRDEYLEAIGDVTKQKDLDGFYRHLYEQKLGEEKTVQKPELVPESKKSSPGADADDDDDDDDDNNSEKITYRPIQSLKAPKQRAYRKHKSASDDEDSANETKSSSVLTAPDAIAKKIHLHNNIDADSDFSIDDSSSDEEDKQNDNKVEKADSNNKTQQQDHTEMLSQIDPATIALKLQNKRADDKDDKENIFKAANDTPPNQNAKEQIELKPKVDKSAIWRKRTVGDVYDAAVKRYFERKAMRYA